MDNRTIFTKTAKGVGEAVGKTKLLSRDFRKVLKEIDGNASLGLLLDRLSSYSEKKLRDMLAELAREDYIREFVQAPARDTIFNMQADAKLEDALSKTDDGRLPA